MARLNSNSSITRPPYVKKGRSKFDLSHSNHMDFGVGLLYPIDRPIEVIPGDTISLSQRSVIRIAQPLKVSPMDTLVADVTYFFTPYRQVWSNWNDFITGNTGTIWNTISTKTVPQIFGNMDVTENTASISGMLVGGLLDYLGVPPHSEAYDSGGSPSTNVYFNSLFSRCYYHIWNWYWRYEPLMQEALVPLTDTVITLANATTYQYGPQSNKLCPVVRLGDYFTRCLPAPQKGPDVALDLSLPASLYAGGAPDVQVLVQNSTVGGLSPDEFSTPGGGTVVYNSGQPGQLYAQYMNYAGISNLSGFYSLFGGSVNGLREAFAIQKIRDIDALYGQRIDDYTEGHFGVRPPSTPFKPEFLGSHRFEINFNQVVQTSDASSASSTELGEIGGYSFTKHEGKYFTKSFTEFGCIMGLICVRVKHHSYAQGIDRAFLRKTRFDYWLPEMSNMPDQSVVRQELFTNTALSNTYTLSGAQVFGYQERGADYKFMPSRVAGRMRPQVNQTLDVWTYTDNYASQPTLSASWIIEPTDLIDRSLYIPSGSANPFIGHFFFDVQAYRELPYHSIPGGLTHQF